jgi:hypothetical protein
MPIAWLQKFLGNNQGMGPLVTGVSARPVGCRVVYVRYKVWILTGWSIMVLELSLAEFRVL